MQLDWTDRGGNLNRHALGFSQEDLADRACLDRTTIGRVERGEFRATLEIADAMARACGVPLWQILLEVEHGEKT